MSISTSSIARPGTRFLAGVSIVACVFAATLAPTPSQAATTSEAASQVASASATPDVDQKFLEALTSLAPGESMSYSINGSDIDVSNVDGQLRVDVPGAESRSVCGWTIASGVVLLGAAAIATLAVATAGAGGAIIAGQIFTTSQLWAAAGLAGAWGALLTWVESHFC